MSIDIREIDVRPILRNGGEPFPAIMEAVGSLLPGQALRLLAPFRPQPLFNVMASRGYDHAVRQMDDGDFEVLFTPQFEAALESSADAELPQLWPDPILDLDLTDLDPPEPMVRILAAAEKLEAGQVMFALLSREPKFLYPELGRRGHQWVGNFDDTGAVFRIMIRVGGELDRDVA